MATISISVLRYGNLNFVTRTMKSIGITKKSDKEIAPDMVSKTDSINKIDCIFKDTLFRRMPFRFINLTFTNSGLVPFVRRGWWMKALMN